jgi:hypothetical protein
MHGRREHLGRSVRMKSDPEHPGRTARPQQQRAVNLPGEKTTRLAAPLPILESLEWVVPVEDQLRMPVGDDALRRGVLAIVSRIQKL